MTNKSISKDDAAYAAQLYDDKKISHAGRPVKYSMGNPKTTMTLSVTAEHKDKIKIYAMQNHITVSELFMKWIDENCN